MIIVCIYVDDLLIIGPDEATKLAISELNQFYSLKQEGSLVEYIGCSLLWNHQNNSICIWQPNLLRHLKETFGPHVTHLQRYGTPGTP